MRRAMRMTPARVWKSLIGGAAREPNGSREAVTEAGSHPNREITSALETLYRGLLGRDPDPAGLAHYASIAARHDLPIREIALLLMNSVEFGRTNADLLSRLPCVINFSDEWRTSTRRYYEAIDGCGFSLHCLAEAYDKAGLAKDEYTILHLRRFYELFGYLTARFVGAYGTAELLEIGTAGHSTPFYRQFLNCHFDTICRPPGMGGPTTLWAVEAGSRTHWEVDLNYPERYAAAVEQVPRSKYDAVICTEVVEHLTKAPRELLKFALSTLNESGFLYLSTPNFLRPSSLNCIYSGISPVPGFGDYNDNFHAHHHFREYTVRELIHEVAEAGGVTQDVIFSNCWDDGRYDGENEFMFRSNLVMIIRRDR